METEKKSWWTEYKLIHFKKRMDCTVEELEKKLEHSMNLTKTFIITAVIVFAVMMDLWMNGKASVTLNTLFLLLVIALWNENTERNNIQLFIYFKKRENVP